MPHSRGATLLRDAVISVTVALGLLIVCEIVLRVAAPQVPRIETLDGPNLGLTDERLGHRYRPLARARHVTPEFDVEYAIDDRGLRARSTPAPADTASLRVVFVGDSFTFGDANAEPDTWVRLTEATLRQRGYAVECVNAGVQGYDTRAELWYLRELLPALRPDVVVLGFTANDVYSNAPEETPAPSSALTHRGSRSRLHVVALARRIMAQNDHVYTRLFAMSSRNLYYAIPPGEHAERQYRVTRDLMAAMNASCRMQGVPFLVVSIPQQFSVLARARDLEFKNLDASAVDANLVSGIRNLDFPWVETLPLLADTYRASDVPLFYRLDGHLTPAGNRVVADIAARVLEPVLAGRAGGNP